MTEVLTKQEAILPSTSSATLTCDAISEPKTKTTPRKSSRSGPHHLTVNLPSIIPIASTKKAVQSRMPCWFPSRLCRMKLPQRHTSRTHTASLTMETLTRLCFKELELPPAMFSLTSILYHRGRPGLL